MSLASRPELDDLYVTTFVVGTPVGRAESAFGAPSRLVI
jgi:hypothetical protein